MSDISPEERARKIGGCVLNDEIRAYVIDLAHEEIRAAEQAAREDERSKIQHDCEQAILDFDRDSLAAFANALGVEAMEQADPSLPRDAGQEWKVRPLPEIADSGLERMRGRCAKWIDSKSYHGWGLAEGLRALPLHEETSDG